MAIRLTVDDNTSAVLTLGENDETTLSADAATVVVIDDYTDLRNKPQIEGVELVGDKSLNDLGAYTDDQVDTLLLAKADRSDIPSLDGYATEQWVENKHYLTTETDPTVPSWAKSPNKPTYTASEVGALPSDTAIPSKTSDLTNDSGFITLADLPIYDGGVS